MQTKKINIRSERRTKLIHRNILSTLDTSLLFKTGATFASICSNIDSRRQMAQQSSCKLQRSLPLRNNLKQMAIDSIRYVAYKLIFWRVLGCPFWVFVFLCHCPERVFYFKDHNDFYLNVLLPAIFSCTLLMHCSRCQTRESPVQIHCQSYAGGADAACPRLPTRPNPLESGFHAYITFAIHQCNTTTNITPLLLPYNTFLLHYHTFYWYIIEIYVI